jgi:hypothetical protein
MKKNTTTLTLRLSEKSKKELQKQATFAHMSLNKYVNEEILLKLPGYYIACPKCGQPVVDKRDISVTGKATLVCTACGKEFEHDFDE